MAKVTIYHNPRCSKSRQTLQLLEERGVELEVIEYLKDPPSATMLRRLLGLLGVEASGLVRRKEPLFQELGLARRQDDSVLITAMAENPILMERPIVVHGDKARIGRPPEAVLEIL